MNLKQLFDNGSQVMAAVTLIVAAILMVPYNAQASSDEQLKTAAGVTQEPRLYSEKSQKSPSLFAKAQAAEEPNTNDAAGSNVQGMFLYLLGALVLSLLTLSRDRGSEPHSNSSEA